MDPEVLSGWGRTSPSRADVEYPADEAGVRSTLRAASPRGVIARGLGRSYGDAAQNAGGTVITTTRMARHEWVDPAAGEVRVTAGESLERLMRDLVPAGWFVPVTPGTRQVTVGGAIAADIHGKNHHRDGGFARHVTSLTLATVDGVTTVSPSTDPDLFWATAGGMGLTGVILEATVRMLPIATSAVRVLTERAHDLDDVMARMEARDAHHRYSVAWLDALAPGAVLGRGVITWGDHAGVDDLPAARRADPLAFAPSTRLAVPDLVPDGLLRGFAMAAFNRLYFRRAPAAATTTVESLGRFFHPLDAVADWNRLYGRTGFVQYQFVVPFDAARVVREALERLRRLRCPSYLVVLKRMGDGGPGPLAFAKPGWTLALDLPVGPAELSAALDDLDELVAEAGGRIYLAKDARLRPELLEAMYPDLPRWREVKRRVDPKGVFTSDLSRRLGL